MPNRFSLTGLVIILLLMTVFPALVQAQVPGVAVADPAGSMSTWLDNLIPDGMKTKILFLEQWQWLLLAIIGVVAGLIQKIASHLGGMLLQPLLSRVGQSKKTTEVINSIGKSLGWFASAGIVNSLHPLLKFEGFGNSLMEVAVRGLATIGALLLAYRLVDLISSRLEESAAETDSKLDDQLAPMIRKSLKLLVTTGAVIYLIQSTGEDVMPLVT
ncbi:MAG: hypothetical protein GWP35_06345, partial [Proteobacteria bacterium]|nr:hypothetical protein [Pseudomonadota bacterium]